EAIQRRLHNTWSTATVGYNWREDMTGAGTITLGHALQARSLNGTGLGDLDEPIAPPQDSFAPPESFASAEGGSGSLLQINPQSGGLLTIPPSSGSLEITGVLPTIPANLNVFLLALPPSYSYSTSVPSTSIVTMGILSPVTPSITQSGLLHWTSTVPASG